MINLYYFYVTTARTGAVTDIGKMPGSCSDLRQSGNVISGFYLIMGTQFVEAVYCTFSPLSPGGKFGNILAEY